MNQKSEIRNKEFINDQLRPTLQAVKEIRNWKPEIGNQGSEMGSLQRLLQFRMITEKISKNCFNRLYSTLLMLRSFKYQPDEVMNLSM